MIERRAVGRAFWLRWVAANLLGMAAAQIVVLSFIGYISAEGFSPASNPVGALLVLLFAAALVVAPQAFVLKEHVRWAGSWLVAGLGAWTAGLGGTLVLLWLILAPGRSPLAAGPPGSPVLSSLAIVIAAILLGALVGAAQGRVFGRRRRAWVAVSSIALPLSVPLMLLFAGGLAYGALTGTLLLRLLRHAPHRPVA